MQEMRMGMVRGLGQADEEAGPLMEEEMEWMDVPRDLRTHFLGIVLDLARPARGLAEIVRHDVIGMECQRQGTPFADSLLRPLTSP